MSIFVYRYLMFKNEKVTLQDHVLNSYSDHTSVILKYSMPEVSFFPLVDILLLHTSFLYVFSPILPALCCVAFILLAIAATIVLSLIPIYTFRRSATSTNRTISLTLLLPDNQTLPLGDLNPAQIAILQNYVSFL